MDAGGLFVLLAAGDDQTGDRLCILPRGTEATGFASDRGRQGIATGGWVGVKELARAQAPETELGIAAAIVDGGRWWSLNGQKSFPAASTIKLAILVALAQSLDAGRAALTERREVEPGVVVQGSGVLLGMETGLSMSLADFAYLMIAVSDNPASNVLIDAIGLSRIQQTIAGLGLSTLALNRRFLGRLPGPGEPENFASASDLRDLLLAIATDTAASPAQCAWMRDVLSKQQFRERLARFLPAGVSFGGKYGSLPGYSHDSGLLTTDRGTMAIAVLTTGFADPYAADAFIGEVALAMLDELDDESR